MLLRSLVFALYFISACADEIIYDVDDTPHELIADEFGYVLTPYGYYPSECVHVQPPGTVLHELGTHTELHYEDKRIKRFKPCHEIIEPVNSRRDQVPGANLNSNRHGRSLQVSLSGWQDWTGYYPPKTPVNYFYGDMLIPNAPANYSNQVLFWFIGSQNNYDSLKGITVSILQPVLSWNQPKGQSYSVSNWNCCPSGQVWYSGFLKNLQPGRTIGASITQTTTNFYTVSSTYDGSSVSLVTNTTGKTYDWLDITLEVYLVTSCTQLPNNSATFTNMVATSGSVAVTPSWTISSANQACNGKITILDPFNVNVFKGPAPIVPTGVPTIRPSSVPSSAKTARPSARPTSPATARPSASVSASPTSRPTNIPTSFPTRIPTPSPSSTTAGPTDQAGDKNYDKDSQSESKSVKSSIVDIVYFILREYIAYFIPLA